MRSVIIFFHFHCFATMDARGVIFPLRFSLLVKGTLVPFCGRATSATNTLDFDQLCIKWNHQNCQNDLRKHVKKKKDTKYFVKG